MSPTLPTRALGTQGLRVSALGLGCMGFNGFYGDPNTRGAEADVVLHRALGMGVTLLDTADMYAQGDNERLLGTLLAALPTEQRSRVVLATKFGIVPDSADPTRRSANGHPDYVASACDASLTRLGVDHIDLYYLHRRDQTVPIEETVGAMARLVDAGKVRFLGLSEVQPDTLRRAYHTHPISAVQSEWSLWTRVWETSTFPVARALGVGIVPYSPLGRGFLTGAMRSIDALDPTDYRRGNPRFAPTHFAANQRIVDVVRAVAARLECTPAQLALAWLLAQGPDVVPIPGTTKVSRLEENCGAVDVVLGDADLAELAEAIPAEAAAGERFPAGMEALVDRGDG